MLRDSLRIHRLDRSTAKRLPSNRLRVAGQSDTLGKACSFSIRAERRLRSGPGMLLRDEHNFAMCARGLHHVDVRLRRVL